MPGKKRQPSALHQLFSYIKSRWKRDSAQNQLPDLSLENNKPAALPENASVKPCSATMHSEIYVVWDALGDGRVVGVFDNEELVREILAVNPYYYRFYRCSMGKPTRQALEWLDENQRHSLEHLLSRQIPTVPATPATVANHAQGLIRAATADDFERMVEIWLQASLEAHDFVSSDFWHQNAAQMRSKYLPASENYVYCEDASIIGFMSLQKDSLAALFVAPDEQGRGIGHKLLNYAKTLRNSLSLAVYEKNSRSVKFYSHHGFSVVQSQKDPHTGQSELIMQYSARN